MKKLLLISLATALLYSCEKSNEDQLNENIRSYVETNANDPSSYEPVETVIGDTIFVGDFVTVMKESAQEGIDGANASIVRYEEEIKEDEERVSNSTYESVNKIRQQAIDSRKRNIESRKEDIAEYQSTLPKLDAINNLDEVAFIRVAHRARLKNALGALTLHNMNFLADKDLNIISPVQDDEEWFMVARDLFEKQYVN